jgi:hypothetical protein
MIAGGPFLWGMAGVLLLSGNSEVAGAQKKKG